MSGFEEFLAGTIRMSAPFILAALGEVIVQRSGVINIGIEALMLMGAFTGFAVAYSTGSPALGILAAASSGLMLNALFAFLCVTKKADQIVVGMGLNIAMLGLTGVLLRGIFGIESAPAAPGVGIWEIPVLSSVPYLGKALFAQSIFIYAAGIIAVGLWLYLRSPAGLSLRACGVHPEASDAAGIRVDLTRWMALLFGGIMGGLSGAYLTLAQTSTFAENMSSGRGFIALAVVIFGRWHPIGVVLAALIFGCANQAQFWLQARGSIIEMAGLSIMLPYQVLLALPYVVTLVVLAFFSGKYRGPKAIGKPFVKSV